MKYPAIVLAGGRGKRLSPLTDITPKPLLPVLGEPVISHALMLLCRAGCDAALISTGYMQDKIKERLGGEQFGMELGYSEEERPLGTLGAVYAARDMLCDNFIVMSGDVISDFDLTSAVRFHKERGAEVTVLLCKRSDPRQFGAVVSDKSGKIIRFTEKPGWESVFSDRINTGIYVIKKSVLELARERGFTDFGKELFPYLIMKERPIYGITLPGYWCDIGSFSDYIKCNVDAYTGVVPLTGERRRVHGCRNTVIGEGVSIGEGSSLEECVIGDGAVIGRACRLYRCIVASGAVLCDGVSAEEGCMVLEGATVPKGTHLSSGEYVTPKKKGETKGMGYGRSGISFCDGVAQCDISAYGASLASAIGSSIAGFTEGKLGIGHDGRDESARFADIIASSAALCGAEVCTFGKSSEGMMAFAASGYGLYLSLYVYQRAEQPSAVFLKLTDGTGLLPSRETEAAIISGLGCPSARASAGKVKSVDGLDILYLSALKETGELTGMTVSLYPFREHALAKEAFEALGARVVLPDSGEYVAVNPSGRYILTDGEARADFYRCLQIIFALGRGIETVALPYTAPEGLVETARKNGIEVVYRLARPSKSSYDTAARRLTSAMPYLCDPLFTAAKTLAVIKEAGLSLAGAIEAVPPLCVKEESVGVPDSAKAAVLAALYEEYLPFQISAADGIFIKLNGGSCKLVARDLPRIDLLVSANTEEAAKAVSEEVREKIRRLLS